MEAHVVGIQHAAGPPGIGLLQPVLVRWQSKAAPLSAFALPAVQAILNYKWTRWAKKVLMVEFAIYLLWLLSTVVFAFALIVIPLLINDSLMTLMRSFRAKGSRRLKATRSQIIGVVALEE